MKIYNKSDIPPDMLHHFQAASPGIGLEPTLAEHIANIVDVFREVRRVLRDDGTAWINYGDAYASNQGGGFRPGSTRADGIVTELSPRNRNGSRPVAGLPPKNLMGLPWRVAFALQQPHLRCAGCQTVNHEAAWGRFPNGRLICPGCELSKGHAVETPGWIVRSAIVWQKCLSGGAWLYAETQKGVGTHMLKDLVRLQPETVRLWNGRAWTRVVSWEQADRRGTPVELVLRSGERIGCLPEHRWPTKRGIVSANDLQLGDVLSSCRLPETGQRPLWLTDDALWFAGLYLAEGSRSGDTLQVAGNTKEKTRRDRVLRVARYFGASANVYTWGNSQTINIDRAMGLRAVLDTVVSGRTAKDKRLHGTVWQWDDGALRAIVEGYLDGDGSNRGDGRWRLGFTRNYGLERDLRTLAARLGARLTLKLTTATFDNRRFPAFRGEWCWTSSGHPSERERAEVVEIRRSRGRKFWDVAVADDPHTFALASGVLTLNSNPMPESVRDRPSSAHEMIFLLSKRPTYYYDAEAIREKPNADSLARYNRNSSYGDPGSLDKPYAMKNGPTGRNTDKQRGHSRPHEGFNDRWDSMSKEEQTAGGANARNVWTFATQARPEQHYASFPDELPRRCILAGTSEQGVCAECGAPRERVVETGKIISRQPTTLNHADRSGGKSRSEVMEQNNYIRATTSNKTTGWAPTCDHDAPSCPATVLDPFVGSGTTVAVAQTLGRRGVGLDLSEEYLGIAVKRIEKIPLPLPLG